MKSFMDHLWYMSESLVGVAFFDPMVDTETKIAMVNALKKPGLQNSPRGIKLNAALVLEVTLPALVTSNTVIFSQLFPFHTVF